jgi:hypothetical protein
MKTYLISEGKRVLVKSYSDPTPIYKPKSRNKGTIVFCPCCKAEIPYSAICKQFDFKNKIDRKTVLSIVRQEAPTVSGVVAQKYRERTGQVLIGRTLLNILKEFRKQGLINLKVRSKGRYGRTSIITLCNSREKVGKT